MKNVPNTSNKSLPESSYCIYKRAAAHPKITDILKKTKQLVVKSHDYGKYINEHNQANYKHIPFRLPDVNGYASKKNHQIRLLPNHLSVSKGMTRNKYHTTNTSMMNSSGILALSASPNTRFRNQLVRFNSINKKINLKTKYHKVNSNLLIDMLFSDDVYSELSFDESDIFHKDEEYEIFIKQHIDNLKDNHSENITNSLFRTYNGNAIRMELKSIKVECKNISKPLISSIVYFLPFDYLPLFYYKGVKEFAKFIIAMIKWNAPDFDEYAINPDALLLYLNNFPDENKQKKNTKSTIHNTNEQYSNLKNIASDPYSQPKKKTKQSQIKDIYVFIWNTPKSIYQIEIRMPEIIMNIDYKKKKIVNTFVNYEMMLYLLQRKFLNWDFYIIRYLLSFKQFRCLIEETLSKKTVYANKDSELVNDEVQSKTFNDTEYYRLGTVSSINFADRTSWNKNYYLVFSTDNHNANTFNIVNNLKLNVIFSGYKYYFKFTFNHIRILDIIAKHKNLISILNKLIILDHSTGNSKFNYSFFDIYDNNDLDFEALVFDNGDQTDKSNRTPIYHHKSNYFSKLIPMKLKKLKYNKFTNEIDEEIREFRDKAINKLIAIDMNQWAKYINDNTIDLIHEKNRPNQIENPYVFGRGSKRSIVGGLSPR